MVLFIFKPIWLRLTMVSDIYKPIRLRPLVGRVQVIVKPNWPRSMPDLVLVAGKPIWLRPMVGMVLDTCKPSWPTPMFGMILVIFRLVWFGLMAAMVVSAFSAIGLGPWFI